MKKRNLTARVKHQIGLQIAIQRNRWSRRKATSIVPEIGIPELPASRWSDYLMVALSREFALESVPQNARRVYELAEPNNFLTRTCFSENRTAPRQVIVNGCKPDDADGKQQYIVTSSEYFKCSSTANDLVMPYFCHPEVYRRGLHREFCRLREEPKRILLFFAGTVNASAYGKNFRFPMMPRHEVIRTVLEVFPDKTQVITSGEDLASLDFAGKPIVLVVTDSPENSTEKHLLGMTAYLRFLAQSHYFLAPPGWIMPHCHNLIEAMGVGAVPVLNYADYMHPPLQDKQDCLSFTTPEELIAQVQYMLDKGKEEAPRLRQNVLHYYDEELSPGSFAVKLRQHQDGDLVLHVNDEDESIRLWVAHTTKGTEESSLL